MASSIGIGANKDETPEVIERSVSAKLRDFIPIYITTIERGLIEERHREKRFLDFLKAGPSKDWYHKLGFVGRLSPLTFIRRIGSQREGSSRPYPSTVSVSRRFRVPFVRKINWEAVLSYFKKWIKHPKNVALIIWLLNVAACLMLLFLLVIGALDSLIQNSRNRKIWIQTINQILNALFTILCIYEHPKLFHQFVLLCRWKSKDRAELRKVYCKNRTYRPYERAHITLIVILLHLTCLSQYTSAIFCWGFVRKERPDFAENLCNAVWIGAPVIAFVYIFFGPLQRKIRSDTDEESQQQADVNATRVAEIELRMSASKKIVVTRPQWIGGLFDCWDDVTVAYLSFFCTFCVFGWNLERLGFGNMYVHIVTFILLCIAPFWVFNVAALNISNNFIRESVGIIGIVLCVFGLLYGGYWRIQIRKRFKLPGNTLFCGYLAMTDCMQWIFCWSCSLAQEVRTGNFYDIEDESFCSKESGDGTQQKGSSRPTLLPLPRENGVGLFNKSNLKSPLRTNSCPLKIGRVEESIVTIGVDGCNSDRNIMTPPLPPQIQLEDNGPGRT